MIGQPISKTLSADRCEFCGHFATALSLAARSGNLCSSTQPPKDLMTPTADDLFFLPLGGTGEIGMNLNLYGHDDSWLMVDCGVMFPKPGQTKLSAGENLEVSRGEPEIQMPDPAFIEARAEKLAGLVITHAHEDHIGAVAYLWPKLRCPVYCARFTAEVLSKKLSEHGLVTSVPVIVTEVGDRVQIGRFEVEFLNLTHSIPDPNRLMIRTPVGSVFHTGDWKLDPDPVVGAGVAKQTFERLGGEGVVAMVCDSTNATVAGHSLSEGQLYAGLLHYIDSAPGRVVVACFGSNIARLVTLARVAAQTGRYMGLYGRSLITMHECARRAGVWPSEAASVDAGHLGYLPRAEVLAVATGSQGEPFAALRRLASNTHPNLELEAGDRVIFSSRAIPGNEEAIQTLIDSLTAMGVEVVTSETAALPIHASGHPSAEELKTLYGWIKPQIAVPVHGEKHHLRAHAGVAKSAGVAQSLVGQNGDLFMLRPVPGVRRRAAPVGRVGWVKGKLVKV